MEKEETFARSSKNKLLAMKERLEKRIKVNKYFGSLRLSLRTKGKYGLNFALISTFLIRFVCNLCFFSALASAIDKPENLSTTTNHNVAKQMTKYCNCYYNHIKRLLKNS